MVLLSTTHPPPFRYTSSTDFPQAAVQQVHNDSEEKDNEDRANEENDKIFS